MSDITSADAIHRSAEMNRVRVLPERRRGLASPARLKRRFLGRRYGLVVDMDQPSELFGQTARKQGLVNTVVALANKLYFDLSYSFALTGSCEFKSALNDICFSVHCSP
jgi:hypothetical protein